MDICHRRVNGHRGAQPARALESRSLHRLGVVRRLQGISRRTVARRLNTDVSRVKAQERGNTDLLLSELYLWQKALDVPLAELLGEGEGGLDAPVLRRAQLVRIMKTVLAIRETTGQEAVRRMAQTLIDQLTELMPELKGVSAWHTVGKRRRRDEFGVAAERRLSAEVFYNLLD
jgi:transcriptional regulator with XRE-family HTH domain